MTANVGTIDRLARLILGIVLVALPFVTSMAVFSSTAMTVLSVAVGIVLIATAAMKFCPLYRVLGLNTCRI